jgi:hypothetical protein
MKEDKKLLEKNYKPKSMLFKVESYNSYNSQKDPKTQFKYFSSFDINNEIISETFDDYLLIMV